MCVQYDLVVADDGSQVKKEVGSLMLVFGDHKERPGDRALAASLAKATAQG